MKVQDRIRELRIASQKTQEEVAKLLDVPRPTYAKWEKDIHPDYSMLQKIAKLHNVTVDYLLNGTLLPEALATGKMVIYVEENHIVDLSHLTPEGKKIVLDFINTVNALHNSKK